MSTVTNAVTVMSATRIEIDAVPPVSGLRGFPM
jgi:hypothetical protein